MIKTMVVVCDGCQKEAFSDGRKLPAGWQGIRWVEGIIKRPGKPGLPSGRYEVCSPECLVTLKDRS